MEKILFKNEKEFNSFIDNNTGLDVPGHGTVRRWSWAEEPRKYPCIAVWEIQYNGDGPDMLEYELVYPNDFEEK